MLSQRYRPTDIAARYLYNLPGKRMVGEADDARPAIPLPKTQRP